MHYPEAFKHFTHIVLDEIDERSIDNDLLSLIVKLMMNRDGARTRLVIMSATMQEKLFLR